LQAKLVTHSCVFDKMAKSIKYHLSIEIEMLTNSIVNIISGDSFPTDVQPVSKADVKNIKKKKWLDF
jgi:hypothetical protein